MQFITNELFLAPPEKLHRLAYKSKIASNLKPIFRKKGAYMKESVL